MTAGSVWAPSAGSLSLRLGDGSDLAMLPEPEGWYRPERALLPGERYGFIVDGDGPFPDPRSLSLPDGVHGLSRVVDPAIFGRATNWPGRQVLGGVLYEMHVGTFTAEGTLDAAVARLDDLVALGVDAVELLPLAAFAGERGWGYDGVAPWSVHEGYGGQEALVRFVDAAHARGLGVILDVVHNHLGPEGAYVSRFGRYFSPRHQTPWGDGINLDDDGSAQVRDYLIGSARHFLVDVGVDGLRLDAVHALADDSPTHFLAELSLRKAEWEAETGRAMTLIAESDLNRPSMVMPVGTEPEARGMDAQWADDVHHALHAFFGREQSGYYVDFGDAHALAKALTRVFIHDGGFSRFRGQDWGAPVDPDSPYYDGHSFVVFLQDHDQVGNRAVGDRFAQHAGADDQAAAAALYLLSAFTPMLFMGEEWAASAPFPFFSHLGPDLGPLVTAGRAREFAAMGWDAATPDPQAGATFDSAKLDWAERADPGHARMLAWYQKLIGLRRDHEDLRDPRLGAVRVDVIDPNTLAMRRGDFLVVATRSTSTVQIDERDEVVATWSEVARPTATELILSSPGATILRRS
ncbi:malto-oligosyltrehalose trehalohydrolase [Tessaracoccus aquimaris]|uniref:Malto-oligosyltrehalose trehalohydrolase n=1 Tax=Tessaracoccus aquimaris TaxID=1332264 RepID=A0A1Q2CMC5_9ACTN|nr:malto-oligosyltrehalose trehalohydrolase [Tessaracoccus aquimaris]AQP47210.1 malto-oligosyltrehalose trehalohydrolase [Tessaracoccus aquimaris]